MTNPTQMNCEHSPDGWCLACVKVLNEDNKAIRRLFCAMMEDSPYMDDGEAQGDTIDYLRDSPSIIMHKIRVRNGLK